MMVARWFSDDFSSLSEYLRPGTPHHQVVIIVLKPPTIFYSILPIMASSLPMGSAAFPKSNLHLKFLRNGQAKSSSIGFVVEETLFLSPRFPHNLIQNWGKFIPGLLNWIYNPDLFHENLHQVLLTGGFSTCAPSPPCHRKSHGPGCQVENLRLAIHGLDWRGREHRIWCPVSWLRKPINC